MTATVRATAGAAPRRAVTPAAAASLAAAAALASALLRLALAGRSFDVYVDEVIYTDLGHSIGAHGLPWIEGRPFFLHPPGFFWLEAGWAELAGHPSGPIAAVGQMRALNAVLAGFTAALIVLLVARAARSLPAAAVAGLLFTVDPFCIRQNDHVLLETAMMAWVLAGYLGLALLIGAPKSLRTAAGAVGAGALFGMAVLTKDEAALITLFPLLAAAALGWGPPRRVCLTAAATTVASYGAYLVAVAALGDIAPLWQAKTIGAQRLLGLIQVTGFHRPGAPPLGARLTAQATTFGMTYAVIVAALVIVVPLVRWGEPLPRLLALLHGCALLTLGYAVALGTLEEQELYLLVIPSLLTLPVAASHWLGGQAGRALASRRTLAAACVAILAGLNLAATVQWLAHPDDGYARLRQYLLAHVRPGSAIIAVDGSTERGTTAWVLGDRYRVGRWVSAAAQSRERARYLVVPWGDVRQGYSYLSAGRVRSLAGTGMLEFAFRGRTYGELALYRLPLPSGAGWPPPLPGVGWPPLPPVTGVTPPHPGTGHGR
jgi:dolichyl-phosphate-mannose-protein mannosyltransferase